MKKLLFIISILPVLALGQSTDQNYVKTTTYKQATTTSVASPDVTVANVQVSYFDGLGRPIQQIAHKQSNTGKDIVTHIEYDQFGRQTRDYLPYVSTGASLNYLPSAQTDLLNFYASPNTTNTGNPHFEATANPFSEKQLESSPLSRVFKQAAPGDPWAMGSGKEIKFDYQTNESTDDIKLFTVTATWNASKGLYDIPTSLTATTYADNQLYKTITKDENWKVTDGKNNTTEEFKDKEGKVVLKRTYTDIVIDGVLVESQSKHDTYYIYDQFGNLTYVIPPLAEGIASEDNLNYLGYQYKYDSRNRLVEKKLPGKDWEFIVYDKLDRPIATGPAYNPYGDGTLGWMITQYDAFGRVIQTGWKKMTVTEAERKNNQNTINSGGNPFTLVQDDILTKNYYDDYSFAEAPNMPQTIEGQAATTATRGLQTGSWVRILDIQGSTTAETSYTLYDFKYRPIRTRTTNFLGGYTEVDSKLDWSGKVEKTITKHKYDSATAVLTTTETFTYSPQDKLVLHIQKINQSDEQLIAKNSYDELGQLIKKEVGGVDITGNLGLQTVDYQYNIRGWLKAINDIETENDLFAFKINYNQPVDATALYNGNISETYWKTASDNILRSYHYKYDDLNRLLEGNYKREGGQYINSYLEKLSYDKNGNILDLFRNGDNDAVDYEFNIDDLKYFYHPQKANQLMKVTDHSNSPQGFKDDIVDVNDVEDDYEYDDFGNMVVDANKDIIDIDYNHLNLPIKIYFGNGTSIIYLYNATGQKVRKVVHSNDIITTDYLGGFQYHNNKLKHFPHAEGYVNIIDIVENKFKYVFNYMDHLGNVRLSYSDANENNVVEEDEILEENHYYPFGLKHTAYNTNHRQYVSNEELNEIILEQMPKFAGDGSYNYKYNGKEYQDELGLNMYDYGARNYDPALGRWMNIDPLAELYDFSSTYAYVVNSPLVYIDPDGMKINFAEMLNQKDGLNTVCRLLLDLAEQTGLSLSLNFNNEGSFLDYEKDGDGNAIVSRDEEYGHNKGSKTARNDLMGAIDDKRILNVNLQGFNTGSRTAGLNISLDPVQIDMHISSVSDNLNEKTLGYGMTFLHELQHTDLRGNLDDTDQEYKTGPTVDRINVIRQELDENDGGYFKQYGIRKYYLAFPSQTKSINKNYENIISIVRFSVINNQGESKNASLKTKVNKRKQTNE